MRNLTLKADRLGVGVTPNPRLALHGSGANAYIWIGNDDRFVGIARNTPETRDFLRKALKRMERGGRGRVSA